MDPETRALVRHLFAEITSRLEATAEMAAQGQGAARRAGQDLDLVVHLEAALTDTGALVGATRVFLTGHAAPRPGLARGRRRKSRAQ